MRYKVFVDTNILLSGIFFEGNTSRILDLVEIDLITSADNVAELRKVIVKKLRYLKERTLEIALAEAERALGDIEVIHQSKYIKRIEEASLLISHKKDFPILAAVLAAKPDYFLTGDTHFFTEKVKRAVSVLSPKEFLEKITRK